MNDLYIHQLETENKQLREALKTTREVLEEQQQRIDKAIEYIKDLYDVGFTDKDKRKLLEILGDK